MNLFQKAQTFVIFSVAMFLLSITIVGCSSSPKVADMGEKDHSSDSLGHVITDSILTNDSFTAKLKNGKYTYPYIKNQILTVRFKNDTLDGKFTISGGYKTEGNFTNGHFDGLYLISYPKHYEGTFSDVLSMEYYANDTLIWLMHPAADFGRIIPDKGIQTKSGIVTIEALYPNGDSAYFGTFNNHLATGIHLSYKPGNILVSRADYEQFTYSVYDESRNVIQEDSLSIKHPLRSLIADKKRGPNIKNFIIKAIKN